ncbi:MAG TPA: PAS domain-containing protein [Kiritimatiellia bacterium]|nr:PAS domain-containing protein [Kiritimatiellia bacterium]HPS07396.1 PAS domain-containing protein [Kiritimatiellia bacterium]
MKTNEKSQTIKIDIRSLGYGRLPGTDAQRGTAPVDYFDKLDYRFLFEHAYDAILLADGAGKVLAANARATRFFGYEEVGLTGLPLHALVAGVTDALLAEIRTVIAEGRYMRIQAFAVHKDDAFTAVEIVAMGNGTHSPDPVCYLVRDIQSRWRAEQKLLSAYHAMDNTDAGIGIADMRGVITYANRMMTELLAEGDEAAVVGQHLDAWFDRKAVIDPLLANIRAGEGWTGEQRTMAREKTGWLMISAVPDINEESELCGMVLSVRDTAERRRAEIAEQQAERNRVMAESLSQACHSLGQPATVLLTGIEILKLEGDKDEALRREMVDLCYGAVIQLRDLLQQMNAKRLQGGRGEEKAGEAAPAVSPPPGAADEERVR